MKIFRQEKFDRIMRISLPLLFFAGLGFWYSVYTFTRASAPLPNHEAAFSFFLVLLPILFVVIMIAFGLAVFSVAVLLRREALGRKETELRLNRFRQAADVSFDLIAILDKSGRITYVNAAAQRITGFRTEDLVNKRHTLPLPWYGDPADFRRLRDTVLQGNEFFGRISGYTKDKKTLIFEERAAPFRNAKRDIVGIISTAHDLTRELSSENLIDYLNRFDQLTGLPNRLSLINLLEQTVASAKTSGAFVSVLMLDIDHFKRVNGVCGVEAGNAILKTVAARIRSAISPADVVARPGNDEFAVIHVNPQKPVLAGGVAQRIRTDLSLPITVEGQELALTVGIGIAVYPADGYDAQSLLKNADLALDRAKTRGRNVVQFFNEEITTSVKETFTLEKSLIAAFTNNEYRLHYQPYCDLVSRKVSGAEALIRWQNPDLGIVSPDRFIPCLEDTGKMIEVGRWILETACSQSKEWEQKNRHFPVAVNLSHVQFHHQYMVGMVKEVIDGCKLDPRRLTIEVTETVLMHDMDFAVRILSKLKDLGVMLSVDDFGTGHSSLSYIKRFPVDCLKIDMSFVRDITTDQDTASIVTAITAMARSLNLKTIAEGIETEEQRNILHLLRCDMGQGYLFSPAVDAPELDKILSIPARPVLGPDPGRGLAH